MSLSVTGALRDGVERTATPIGAGLLAVLLVARLAAAVVVDTRLPTVAAALNDLSGDQVLEPVRGPMAVDLPAAALTGLSLLAAIVTAAVVALGFRAFAGDRHGRLPADAWDGLAWATLNVLVAQLVLGSLFGIGLALFVLPGIVVAVAFVFVPAAIAVDGHNALRAMVESWRTARGSWLRVLLVLVGIAVVGFTFNLSGTVLALLLFGEGIGVDVVGVLFGSLVVLYAIGTVASAFDQLRTVDDEFGDIDDELLP
ncbi:MAG: hypothetical protein ACI9YT_000903 [Halobacteriales archaeon]|jgi:hypothetical protein